MATIKSYTDIEQSRKLAEILSIESADMCYIQDLLAWAKYGEYKPYIGDLVPAYGQGKIRCWSLAALLNVLPKIIKHETLFVETSASLWHVGYRGIYTVRSVNLVDACYEMILKLHELKML